MPRIRIVEDLPQAKYGAFMQSADSNGDPDDEWIRKMFEYESTKGSSTGDGLSNFGYNNWKKLGHAAPPSSIEEAIEYFKKDFLPKLQKYPAGLRERLGDYMFNTGRSINDLLLYNAGKITLDQLNSPKTFDKEWQKYGSEIEKMYSDPNFINKLDQSRDQVYKTTNQIGGKPNPAYNASWKGRVDLYKTSGSTQNNVSSTPTVNTPATTNNTSVTGLGPSKGTVTLPSSKLKIPIWDLASGPSQGVPVVKGPYEKVKGPVATPQATTIDVAKRSDGFDPWMPTNVDITGKQPPIPVNPDAPKVYPIQDRDDLPSSTVDSGPSIRQRKLDKTLKDIGYGITHPAQTIGKGADWLNNQIIKGANWLNNNKRFQKFAKTSEGAVMGALKVSPIIQYITDLENQRGFNRAFTLGNLSDNLYPVRPASMTGNRGDWTINEGIFRPNEIGFKSKGMYTNKFDYSPPGVGVNAGFTAAYGGSINNNPMQKVRIRITGGTEKMATGGQPMTYSGQLGYGLNLGQKRIYTDMPPEKTETINKTIKPVPRDQANIEAEKGETVFGDIDGDGAMEHMLIGGKKHTEGGTPLNVPEGSFIFSDTKDLIIKDKKVLDKFSMPSNKKGYTPAEIAKKYDTTKYKAIIEDPNSDNIKKGTAQIMVKTFEKKLAELALIQEQMKGFPQGIPEVAKKYFPELQTREDQEKQPGASENIQYGQQEMSEEDMMMAQQGAPMQEMAGQMEQEEPMQQEPQMAWGGMIPRFDLAGQVQNTPYFAMNDDQLQQLLNNANTGNVVAGPGDPDATDQTYTPAQRAALNDPEFAEFIELLTKSNYVQRDPNKYKPGSGKYYIKNLSPDDARKFARLATKFGFHRQAEGNIAGFDIVQGPTQDYTITIGKDKNKKTVGFFGGFTPDLYERRVIEDIYGKDASDRMTDLERRKAYFKELGVDISGISDAKLSNPKILYKDKNFFLNKFYPAFSKTFAKEGFRPEMGDDMYIGAEHYDSYKTKPKPVDETTIGYKCTGRDKSTRKPNVISSSYINVAARDADGAVASEAEALKQCPDKPWEPGKLKEGCPPGYYKDTNGTCVKIPFDYMTPDKVTMLATALGAPKKYLPWGQKLAFEPGDVVFKDWRAKAAERQSLYNKMADQLNTYSPGAATASNLSFLAAQTGEGLSKDIDEVDAYNVQTANAFSDRERQRKDQVNMLNLAKAEELYKGNVIANQQYDNAKRAYFNNMAKAFGNAWKNRMYLGLLNSVNPMFNIDPWEGQSHFKGGYDENDLFGGFGSSTASSGSTYRDRMADYLRRGYTIADARKYAAEDDRKGLTASSTNSKKATYDFARSLMGAYGSLGGGFNPDEEAS